MSILLPFQGPARVTIPPSARIAVYSAAPYTVSQLTPPLDINNTEIVLFNGSGLYRPAVFAGGATLSISGGADSELYYSVGTVAQILELLGTVQGGVAVLDATGGTMSAGLFQLGIVTCTPTAAVTGTLDTGANMEAANTYVNGDCFDWSLINLASATHIVTVASAASGNTLIGSGAVAAASSGRFRTHKLGTATFNTYRLA
jgi:hypothetical protein